MCNVVDTDWSQLVYNLSSGAFPEASAFVVFIVYFIDTHQGVVMPAGLKVESAV